MQVQINTDHNIEGREALADHVRSVVEDALSRFSEHITRVEVHLSDQDSGKKGGSKGGKKGGKKGGNDHIRCMMEARLEGHRPIAVTHQTSTLAQAVDGAVDKLTHLIESTLGRLHDRKSHRTNPSEPGTEPAED